MQTDLLALVRQHDPDRFLWALLAPAEARPSLLALIGFNHELAHAVAAAPAREGGPPVAALIRLQWWREVVENARADWQRHEVAVPLRALLDVRPELAPFLLEMVEAREAEAEGFEDAEAWRRMLLGGAGALQRAWARLLGVEDAELLSGIGLTGAAYAAGATRRYLPLLFRSGRVPLPAPWVEDPPAAAESLRREGLDMLRRAGRVALPRPRRSALLAAALAKRDLRRDPVPGGEPRGAGDRLAVVLAALRSVSGS
jgi:15-cis-phytoene synthase